MISPEQEWFKQYLEEKFKHLETKISNVEETCTATLAQATKTNGRVNSLEIWRTRTEGVWYGINKTGMVISAIFGVLLSIMWDWFKTIKMGVQ